MMERWGVRVVAGSALAWVVVVLLSGGGFNLTGVEWSFERTGQLGDSFGVLSSLMAGVAAYFAYNTYRSAIEEGVKVERRAAETSFLNLFERRFDVLAHVGFTEQRVLGTDLTEITIAGQSAIETIATRMRGARAEPSKQLRQIYNDSVRGVSGVPSLLRFTYHIVALIDRQFPQKEGAIVVDKGSQAYQYIRLLRAQLSDAELLLIALNCVVGKGYGKFRPLVEKYALLHNLPYKDRRDFGLNEFFVKTAFGLDKEDRQASNDSPPKEWLEAMRPGNQ
ncbi:putative phage abortive infection protein [Sphingomonas sp. Leaf10]|uniref:putative phage abortive infection protein n=1 Tax=Sphingomonas sp. Leaf10 TaxID=1735676 RepID=UPI0006FA1178|nr:putative phage abortive infection protein [Sphingomonas sp. Leaf10]KQM38799.1 hypothetical protein ASE59_11105 [Sphingomonas sp. Leaf10]